MFAAFVEFFVWLLSHCCFLRFPRLLHETRISAAYKEDEDEYAMPIVYTPQVLASYLLNKIKTENWDGEKIYKNLSEFCDIYGGDYQTRCVLSEDDSLSPTAEKHAALDELLKLYKIEYEAGTVSFLKELINISALNKLSQIVDTLNDIEGEDGVVAGSVTSAQPLSDEQYAAALQRLETIAPEGAKLRVKREVDPKLLGGLVLQVGSKALDLSVASHLAKFETTLRSM